MTAWILLGCFLGAFAMCVQGTRMSNYQQRVIGWCDEREVFFATLVQAAQGVRSIRLPPPTLDTFFVNGMLSRNGVEQAQTLLTAAAEQQKAVREAVKLATADITMALQELAKWEAVNPVPPKPRWL